MFKSGEEKNKILNSMRDESGLNQDFIKKLKKIETEKENSAGGLKPLDSSAKKEQKTHTNEEKKLIKNIKPADYDYDETDEDLDEQIKIREEKPPKETFINADGLLGSFKSDGSYSIEIEKLKTLAGMRKELTVSDEKLYRCIATPSNDPEFIIRFILHIESIINSDEKKATLRVNEYSKINNVEQALTTFVAAFTNPAGNKFLTNAFAAFNIHLPGENEHEESKSGDKAVVLDKKKMDELKKTVKKSPSDLQKKKKSDSKEKTGGASQKAKAVKGPSTSPSITAPKKINKPEEKQKEPAKPAKTEIKVEPYKPPAEPAKTKTEPAVQPSSKSAENTIISLRDKGRDLF